MELGVEIIVTLIVLLLIGMYLMVIANSQYNAEKEEKQKKINEQKQREFQQLIDSIKPDKFVGNPDNWIAFKEANIVSSEESISLDNCAYYHGKEDLILMLPDPYDSIDFEYFDKNQRQEIVDYLDKYDIPQIQSYFRITDMSGIKNKINFNHGYEYAYMINEKDDFFQISGSKDPNLKWKLTNIEFSPLYVTDYEVITKSEENGRINGHAGAAALGGILGGTTGAVIGSSLGREVNSTTISYSNNSAKSREVPSTALLTIESNVGDKAKLAEQYYEEDIIILKKYFLVEDKTKDSSNTVKEENTNLVTELQNLKKMMDEGILTEEEFKLGKRKLLEG